MASDAVPITPSVLDWAIREAGVNDAAVAGRADATAADVAAWRRGASAPRKTQLREVARFLRRPTAFFLLPEPPSASTVEAAFRREPRLTEHRALLPEEAAAIRLARRTQHVSRWVAERRGDPSPNLPLVTLRSSPDRAAAAAVEWLGWDLALQFEARAASAVATRLRNELQAHGVLVVHFASKDDRSCRAFSLYDAFAPLIALNTEYRAGARSFSYLHELGHLVLGDSALCTFRTDRRIERWCEEFAASFLMPADAVVAQVDEWVDEAISSVDLVKRTAGRFKGSLTATAIQLIKLGYVDASVYQTVDALSRRARQKRQPGEGPRWRTAKRRVQTLGTRYPELLLSAERHELLRRSDVLDYLNINDTQLAEVAEIIGD